MHTDKAMPPPSTPRTHAHTQLQKRFVATPGFFRGGPKFDQLLQIAIDTVAIQLPLETPFVVAPPANGRHL